MLHDPTSLNRLVKSEQAYKFLKNVRGSPTYWQQEMYEVLAMLHTLGTPTWFMTLPAADLHWVEMIEAVSIHNHQCLTPKEIRKMIIKEHSEKLKADPVTSITMFKHHVESFFTHYILDGCNPLGQVKEYAIKIEFQEHGSWHAHCLLWVDGAPHIDGDSDDDVCAFVDKFVSGAIPDETPTNKHISDLVKQYETHSHSSYCRCNHSCCFGFPKAPSPWTVICHEPDDVEDRDSILKGASEILRKVHDCTDSSSNTLPLVNVLNALGIMDDTYISALKLSHRGQSIVLHCDPAGVYTNGCNHDVLHL